MTLHARALTTRTAGALWLAVTLYATLRSFGPTTPVPFWGFFAEQLASADYVQNVVLFAPLGWIAYRAGWSLWRTFATGLLISTSIEFSQLWISGRTSQATDILCNTAGATFGWWMATEAVRARVRMGVAFGVLAAFTGLHVLNATWPEPAERADGVGAWKDVRPVACPAGSPARAICLTVPNTADAGDRYLRIVGPGNGNYARVLSRATGRPLMRDDCVLMFFESTRAARLRLRRPLRTACALADSTDRTITLRVHPRLEHATGGPWTRTRAGEWMWPVWPHEVYQPLVLRAVGAVTFVVLAALMAGTAAWVIPAGYLVILELVALVAGLRGPGWLELGWAVVGWLVAVGAVAVDRWWRGAEKRLGQGEGSPGSPQ